MHVVHASPITLRTLCRDVPVERKKLKAKRNTNIMFDMHALLTALKAICRESWAYEETQGLGLDMDGMVMSRTVRQGYDEHFAGICPWTTEAAGV